MSRSNNTEIKNPAKKFFEWSSDNKAVKHYNKEAKANEFEKLPFGFLVLDTLSTIKGYSDAEGSGFWSNEVRDLKSEIFTVRNKNGIVASGYYKDLAAIKGLVGAKYSQSVYIAYKEGENYVLGNINFVGSSLSSWIDFRKKNDIYKGAILITGFTDEKKGKTEYSKPIFEKRDASEAADKAAIALDKELQEYLKVRLNTKQIDRPADELAQVEQAVSYFTEEIDPIANPAQTTIPELPQGNFYIKPVEKVVQNDLTNDLPF